ncbi:MAG: hypothetical protein WAT39_25480 [Planctomycetota bacterium]
MNPNYCAAVLFPFLVASASGQDLLLATTTQPGVLQARVHGAPEGALVVLILGLDVANLKLPGGQILGVRPDLITGFAVANGTKPTELTVRVPQPGSGIGCLGQAVAVQPKLALDQRGGILVSGRETVFIEQSPVNEDRSGRYRGPGDAVR